jgi:hypothetical protein
VAPGAELPLPAAAAVAMAGTAVLHVVDMVHILDGVLVPLLLAERSQSRRRPRRRRAEEGGHLVSHAGGGQALRRDGERRRRERERDSFVAAAASAKEGRQANIGRRSRALWLGLITHSQQNKQEINACLF